MLATSSPAKSMNQINADSEIPAKSTSQEML